MRLIIDKRFNANQAAIPWQCRDCIVLVLIKSANEFVVICAYHPAQPAF